MRHIFLLFLIIVLSFGLNGQSISENLSGRVSFVSSQNIYVKFKTTAGISAGDTLFISSKGKMIPVLKVNNLSSASCVCTSISGTNLSIADEIVARGKGILAKSEEKSIKNVVKETQVKDVSVTPVLKPSSPGKSMQKIRGSISAYSYSNFSNTSAANSTQYRYTLSLDARNIANSKFSVESYLSFRHKMGDWAVVKSNVFNALKIYSLSLRYDLNKTTQISLGRKINSKISSIGAMDGLQVEKSIDKFTLGVLVGSRPDFVNYGFDSKLFQYGGYLAFNSRRADTFTESSLAFMQQTNNSKTDRRFIYFQHSSSLIKNIYFSGTFEIDLYKLMNDMPQNTFNLTEFYLSLRYKMTKNFTLTGSYDERKNVMYYETYKTFIDRILETEMRQSLRLQADYRITRNLMFGIQSGYRLLKTDLHPSKNVYSYLTYSQIPGLNVSVTLSGTYLESNYLNGKIFGGNISRDLFKGKFQTGIGYRYVDYRYPESLMNAIQNIGEMNISLLFLKNMSLSLNYEGTFEKHYKYDRFYLQIRKRF